MDFENNEYYLLNYDVKGYWIGAAVIGTLIPTSAFVGTLFWWLRCKHLWSANQQPQPRQQRGQQEQHMHASTEWLN